MPTYAYECQACGHGFEKFQSMTDKTLRKCPDCGKLKLQRLIGPGAGIIFKGSGFYETDYRSESYKKAASDDKPSSGKKKEAKPEKSPTGDSGSSTSDTSSKD